MNNYKIEKHEKLSGRLDVKVNSDTNQIKLIYQGTHEHNKFYFYHYVDVC